MKTLITMMMWLLLIAGPVCGQTAVFKGGERLDDGQGDDQLSKAYEFSGPYVIRWRLRDVKPTKSQDPLADYWKRHTEEDPPWVSITVREAGTQKVVEVEMKKGFEGQLQIEKGGKHVLEVTGEEHVAWTIWGKPGVLTDKGFRKLRAADVGGGTAESAMKELIAEMREDHSGGELQQRIHGAKLIANRSNSAADFAERWEAYRRAMGW